jgi:hypothetical protein
MRFEAADPGKRKLRQHTGVIDPRGDVVGTNIVISPTTRMPGLSTAPMGTPSGAADLAVLNVSPAVSCLI